MDNDIFAGVHAMFRMTGESTCVLVLCDAVRFNVFYSCIRGLDKVPFVNCCSLKAGSAKGLECEKSLSIFGRDMWATDTFGDRIRSDNCRQQFHWTGKGSGEVSTAVQHVQLVSTTHVSSSVDLRSKRIHVVVMLGRDCVDLDVFDFNLNIGSGRP